MTDYLTGLVKRNQQSGHGLQPRLPSRFEKPRISGPLFETGSKVKNLESSNRWSSARSDDMLTEENEFREIPQRSQPEAVHRPAVRGPAAFTISARSMMPKTASVHEEFPEKDAMDRSNPEDRMATASTKPEVPRPGRSGRSGDGPVKTDASQIKTEEGQRKVPSMTGTSPRSAFREVGPDAWHEKLPIKVMSGTKKEVQMVSRTETEQKLARPDRRIIDVLQAPESKRAFTSNKGAAPLHERPPVDRTILPRFQIPERVQTHHREPKDNNGRAVTQEPNIQVTIGRIEVRAVPRKETHETKRKMPELDLSEYLRQPAEGK